MVIQNNIPGLNSKRNYNKNSSKLAKSLEKLSSGYAINRAADDAAGLAVSEKMRSQICGIKQSVKNCQDGISLIQTFEGALGETVAIIKRMKSLADQSANGTYDDNVDRNAIEIEYLHLCDEVNHIAETDFNGVVMLNGKPDSVARAAEFERAVNSAVKESLNSLSPASSYADVPQTASVSDVSVQAAAFATSRAGGTACGDFNVYGDSSDFSFDTATGVLTILGGDVTVEGTGVATTNTIVVAKDKSANVTLRNVNIDVSGTENVCAFKIEDDSMGDVVVTLEGSNFLHSGKFCAGLQKNVSTNLINNFIGGSLTINGKGKLDVKGGEWGAGIGSGAGKSTYNITINSGDIKAHGGSWLEDGKYLMGASAGIGGGGLGSGINITINGGKITAYGFGYGTGIGGGDGSSWGSNDYKDYIEKAGLYHGCGVDISITNGEVIAINFGAGAGIGGGAYGDCNNINISGGSVTAISSSRGLLDYNGVEMWATDTTGAGIGGDQAYEILISGGEVIALSLETDFDTGSAGIGCHGCYAGKQSTSINITGDKTVVIAKGSTGTFIGDGDNIGLSGNGGTKNVVISNNLIIEEFNGNTIAGLITGGTIVHYADYNSSMDPNKPNPPKPIIPDEPNRPDKLIVSISNAFGNASAKLTYTDNLILQTGARTKDAVNFTFAYSSNGIGGLAADLNCTANGLGIDTLTLKTQASANYAIDKLDHALNKVSMIRATFGAAQNRLEHKIDNLNNTTENLTAAESAIRDTDMAKEMMNFTKNQILTQASQSMLAQANSLPQQVMSLISS